MAALTAYSEEKALEHFLRGGGDTFTPPAQVYIGLFTTLPDDLAAGGVEVSGGSYGRVQITFGAPSSKAIANSGTLTWSAPTADWGLIVGAGIFDASSGGNLMAVGQLTPQATVLNGGPAFALAVGEVIIQIAGASAYFVHRILDLLFRNTAASPFSTRRCRLFTVAPDADGAGGTEVSGTGYAAQTPSFAAYTNRQVNLASDLQFTSSAGSAWGAIPAAAFYEDTNFLCPAPISPIPNVGSGAPMTLLAASTFIKLD